MFPRCHTFVNLVCDAPLSTVGVTDGQQYISMDVKFVNGTTLFISTDVNGTTVIVNRCHGVGTEAVLSDEISPEAAGLWFF